MRVELRVHKGNGRLELIFKILYAECHGLTDAKFGQTDDFRPTHALGKRHAEQFQVGLGKIRQFSASRAMAVSLSCIRA